MLRGGFSATLPAMATPTNPVTFDLEELRELNRKLATMRHDVNNHLSLIVAAVELFRHKPQKAEGIISSLAEQPARISDAVTKFSVEFERTLGLTRSQPPANSAQAARLGDRP